MVTKKKHVHRSRPTNPDRPAKGMNAPRKASWAPAAMAFLIAVITWMAFAPALNNDFTNWDDETYVKNNPLVTTKDAGLREIFSTPVSLNYHPLTILTLKWNYRTAELNPYSYHLTNVWLHVLNTLMIFLFIFLLTRDNTFIASFSALIFGIHPMHVESVAWISERKDVLYVFFLIPALICYLRYAETKNWFWYAAALTLFIASCLSKAMAVVFPLLLLLIDFFSNRKITSRIFTEKIPFLAISLIIGVLAFRIQSAGAVADLSTFTLAQRMLFACYGAMMYLFRFFVPVNLSAFYPYPSLNDQGMLPVAYYATPVLLIMLIASIWLLKKERAYVTGMLFYLLSVALVLQFISVGNAIMADRYSYLAYTGLAFLAGWYLHSWFLKKRNISEIAASMAMMAIFSIVLVPQTRARCTVWKNSETLWSDVISKYPMKVETAYRNRGNYYGQTNQTDKAYADYMTLLRMGTTESKVYSNLGNVYAMRKNADSALWAYQRAIQLDSTNANAHFNCAITYLGLGQYDQAAVEAQKGVQINPANDKGFGMLGFALLNTGKYRECVDAYSRQLELNGNSGDAYLYRAQAYRALGDTAAANRDYAVAMRFGKTIPSN